jgi:hypothetical protein
MPEYVALIDWTDQGVRNFKDTASTAACASTKSGSSFSAGPECCLARRMKVKGVLLAAGCCGRVVVGAGD